MRQTATFKLLLVLSASAFLTNISRADWIISFNQDDFTVNDMFNDIETFDFEIVFPGSPVPGVYNELSLIGVDYQVFGRLAPMSTPSGFTAFDLRRPQTTGAFLTQAEFSGQGSSLSFEIAAGADASDGIQISELVASSGPVFTFDGREVGTGRYHPTFITLNADGTGLFQNSNNMGGVNPGNGMVVDVDFGEEYISQLAFNPSTLTIGTISIPEPTSASFLGIALMADVLRRRK